MAPSFDNNIVKNILFDKNVCIFIQITLKFVLRGPIGNKPTLFL